MGQGRAARRINLKLQNVPGGALHASKLSYVAAKGVPVCTAENGIGIQRDAGARWWMR